MRFLQSIVRYVWDPQWFLTYTKRFDFGDGVWRYARLKFLVSVILGSVGLVSTLMATSPKSLPDIDKQIGSVGQSVVDAYPSGLVMDFTTTGLMTNLTGPLLIPMKEAWKTESMPYTTLVIIDTVTTGVSLTMSGYEDTMVLVTHDAIYVRKSEHEVRTYLMASVLQQMETQSLHVTRDSVAKLVDTVGAWLQSHKMMIFVVGGAIVFFFVIFMGGILSLVAGLLVALLSFVLALIVRLVGAIIMKKYTYGDAYRHTGVLYTLPWIAGVLGAGWEIEIILLIIIAIWVLLRVREVRKTTVAGVNHNDVENTLPSEDAGLSSLEQDVPHT